MFQERRYASKREIPARTGKDIEDLMGLVRAVPALTIPIKSSMSFAVLAGISRFEQLLDISDVAVGNKTDDAFIINLIILDLRVARSRIIKLIIPLLPFPGRVNVSLRS